MNYLDIHTHSFYPDPETNLVLNVFPGEEEKLKLPVLFSAGLHPWHIREIKQDSDLESVRAASLNPRVIAIGETGLDKAVSIPYELQRSVFEKQLDIAQSRNKIVIVHCVRSYSEMLSYRKKADQSVPWIFHWFNSDLQTARVLIRKNCYLSFGHMLFRDTSKAFRTFIELPLEHVFFETDDAGITIQEVYEKAARIRNVELEELKAKIMDNFARCFKTNWNGKLVKPD